mgnify:CR=1 FL=1
MYKVVSNIDGQTEYCTDREEVNDYLDRELMWWNQYKHLKPYTKEDFLVTKED